MTTSEVWAPIPIRPTYEASTLGRIRSPRGVILRSTDNGPYRYQFTNLGQGVRVYVHRAIAEAFLGPVDDMDVDHIDGDPTNNRVDNLRIVTHAENMTLTRERNPACKRGHLYTESSFEGSKRRCWECKRARSRRLGISEPRIGRAS